MITLLLASAAFAGFPGERWNESLVFGANVVVAFGEEGADLGFGVDASYQLQWYTQLSERIDGEFTVWADEHPAYNYGPVIHVWWAAGAWHASGGARFGVTHPLRVGIGGGWWPGPGLLAELAPTLSTAGYVGVDGQVVVEGPWIQARLGAAWTPGAIVDRRLHLGAFVPVEQARNWSDITGDVWEP